MADAQTIRFSSPPSIWALYPRVLAARKPATLRPGSEVPRIDATLSPVRIARTHLAQYRDICAAGASESLPLAYPHLLANPLHLSMLSSSRFPLKLLGLVHVQNRVEQLQGLPTDGGGEIETFIEGHRDTERGQEFELHTLWRVDGQVIWREVCTFLARRRKPAAGSATGAAAAGTGAAARGLSRSRVEVAPPGAAVATVSFRADAGLGRRYGMIAGDINPIHLFDLTARAFGFSGAIAHGMWSMARCAAELEPVRAALGGRCVLEVQFKLPVYLPAWLQFESWSEGAGAGFALRDTHGERLHLVGSMQPATG